MRFILRLASMISLVMLVLTLCVGQEDSNWRVEPRPELPQDSAFLFRPKVFVPDSFMTQPDVPPEPRESIWALQRNIKYPEKARRENVEGIVYVEAYIDERGDVVAARVLRGIRKDLDNAAMEAVGATKFKPAKIRNQPAKSILVIPIRFGLKSLTKP